MYRSEENRVLSEVLRLSRQNLYPLGPLASPKVLLFYCTVLGYLLSKHCCPAASHDPSRLYQTLLEILINRLPREVSVCFSLYLLYFPLPREILLKTVGFHSLREINCGFLTTPMLLAIVTVLAPIPLGNST